RGNALLALMRGAKQVTVTSANGTNVTFALGADKAFVSEGAVTLERMKRGAPAFTWLPAGEVLSPLVLGSAEGKIVVDKLLWQGTLVQGLTLTLSKGKVTGMTAASGLDALKAEYDAASGGKDALSFIDIGLNPDVKLPTNTGRVVWMAAGGITLG